ASRQGERTRNRRAQLDALHRWQYLGWIRRQRLIQPSAGPESFYSVDGCFICLGAVGLQNETPAELQPIRAIEFTRLFVVALWQHALELPPDLAVPVFPEDVKMLAALRRQVKDHINRALAGQRQQRVVRDVKMMWRVLQQLLFERLKGFASEKRRAVINVLITSRPEADDLFKLRGSQAGRALRFKDDLIVALGRRRRGDA